MEQKQLVAVESFPQKDDPRRRVFPEAKLSCAVFVARSRLSSGSISISVHAGQFIDSVSDSLSVKPSDVVSLEPENIPIPSCTQGDWNLALSILSRQGIRRIGDYCTAFQGEVNETADGKRGFISDDPTMGPQVLRGSNLGLYTIREASQGRAIFLRKDRFLSGKPGSEKANHHRSPRIGWQEARHRITSVA